MAFHHNPHAASWHFVMDRVNTPMSEAAVRAVARVEGSSNTDLALRANPPV